MRTNSHSPGSWQARMLATFLPDRPSARAKLTPPGKRGGPVGGNAAGCEIRLAERALRVELATESGDARRCHRICRNRRIARSGSPKRAAFDPESVRLQFNCDQTKTATSNQVERSPICGPPVRPSDSFRQTGVLVSASRRGFCQNLIRINGSLLPIVTHPDPPDQSCGIRTILPT